MPDDYGYFGSGSEGYAHYVAASGEDEDKRNRGGGNKGRGKPGCFTIAVILLVIYLFIKSLS